MRGSFARNDVNFLFIRFSSLRPVVIPHHMGRKRMHLELKDTMTRVGGDIKAKVEYSQQNK